VNVTALLNSVKFNFTIPQAGYNL